MILQLLIILLIARDNNNNLQINSVDLKRNNNTCLFLIELTSTIDPKRIKSVDVLIENFSLYKRKVFFLLSDFILWRNDQIINSDSIKNEYREKCQEWKYRLMGEDDVDEVYFDPDDIASISEKIESYKYQTDPLKITFSRLLLMSESIDNVEFCIGINLNDDIPNVIKSPTYRISNNNLTTVATVPPPIPTPDELIRAMESSNKISNDIHQYLIDSYFLPKIPETRYRLKSPDFCKFSNLSSSVDLNKAVYIKMIFPNYFENLSLIELHKYLFKCLFVSVITLILLTLIYLNTPRK